MDAVVWEDEPLRRVGVCLLGDVGFSDFDCLYKKKCGLVIIEERKYRRSGNHPYCQKEKKMMPITNKILMKREVKHVHNTPRVTAML